MIIGLAGTNGSGKGAVARYLREQGYTPLSLSDVLREELARRGQPVDREALMALGNELREAEGPGVLAERVIEKIDSGRHYVVDSVRHPAEAEALRRRSDFFLVRIDAPPEVRFERIRHRSRENDPSSYEEFLDLDRRELEGGDEEHQQLARTMETTDYEITNDGTLAELHRKVDLMLGDLGSRNRRPSWDEYFMGIARVVAMRSNCISRKVASIIVKDRRIISTGYNGTPRGTKNCNEGGCPRCNASTERGKNLEECYCSHGEENAIVQAAYHGISVKGSTIYTTCSPCLMCTKMIINAGLEEVVYNEEYPLAEASFDLLREAGLRVRKFRF